MRYLRVLKIKGIRKECLASGFKAPFKVKPSEINNFRDNRFQDKPINLSELNYKTLVFDKIGSW